jgi:AcrR family transcriptional regulator
MEQALDHAVALMGEEGVGALSVSEVARRMGIRGPSLYKYFPSRHALYDALFARGLAAQQAAVRSSVEELEPGLPRLRAGAVAVVSWAVANPALAQLLHWRAVPGFEPTPAVLGTAVDVMTELRGEFAAAVERGQLAPTAATDDAVALYTVVLSGLISQQLANQPGLGYAEGTFSRLTGAAIEMFLSSHTP